MGIQGPEGPKGPAGPPGLPGKDATVDYTKVTSDSSLKDSIKSLILSDASFKANVNDYLKNNPNLFKGPAGADGTMSFEDLTEAQISRMVSNLLNTSSSLNILINKIMDKTGTDGKKIIIEAMKLAVTDYLRNNVEAIINESLNSGGTFETWYQQYFPNTTIYCANGKCVVPTGNASPNNTSKWSLVADDSAFRFRQSDITDQAKLDRARINKDGSVFVEGGIASNGNVQINGGMNVNDYFRARKGIWGRDSDNEVQINGPLRIGNWKIEQAGDGNLHFSNNNGKQFSMQANDGQLATKDGSSWKKLVRAGDQLRIRDLEDNAYLWASSSAWGVHRWKQDGFDANDNRGKWYIENL